MKRKLDVRCVEHRPEVGDALILMSVLCICVCVYMCRTDHCFVYLFGSLFLLFGEIEKITFQHRTYKGKVMFSMISAFILPFIGRCSFALFCRTHTFVTITVSMNTFHFEFLVCALNLLIFVTSNVNLVLFCCLRS